MSISFISDPEPKHHVYQCGVAGVPQYAPTKSGRVKKIGSTTDHTDRYYVQEIPSGPLTRVKPVDLGVANRKSLSGGTETYHRWGFAIVKAVA